MKKMNLSIDIGGTHSRLQFEAVLNGKIEWSSQEHIKKINSKDKLRSFIQNAINENGLDSELNNCVIGFAGAVIDHREVEITNWKNRPILTLDELISWGLPKKHTVMLNDMELAGYGIIDMQDRNELKSKWCETLYQPLTKSSNKLNNKIILAPGTGFGTSSIIEFVSSTSERIHNVLSSEIQHIQVPALNSRHADIIQLILEKKRDRIFLNYEDFVSGKGLKETYEAILELEGMNKPYKDSAEIARSAILGKDNFAIEALNLFYSCVGRIMQAMALMAQPYGGIYLCGASTICNSKFIPQSNMIKEFHNCLIRKQLLSQFPVYLITKPDINIAGGLWLCRNPKA